MNNNIKLNIELTPAEADEVIAGLNNHSVELSNLAQRILVTAQSQYAQIAAKQQEEQEAAMKEAEKENKKGDNK